MSQRKSKETFFELKLLKRIRYRVNFCRTRQIVNKKLQTGQTLSHLFTTRQISKGNSSVFGRKFLQRLRFWIILLTTRQILNRNFNNATDFHVQVLLKNQHLMDTPLSKNQFFWSPYIVRKVKVGGFALSFWKLVSESDVFGKQKYFELKILKKIRFWIEVLKTSPISSQTHPTQQSVNGNFYIVSEREMKVLQRIRFLSKIGSYNSLRWICCFQKQVCSIFLHCRNVKFGKVMLF